MKLNKIGSNSLILSICELIIGILLFIDPQKFTSSIIMVIGIVLCVLGLRALFLYFRASTQEAVLSNQFLTGMLLLTGGAFCAINSQWFIDTFPILTVIYGVAILFTGMAKLQETVNKIRLKYERWYISGISALLTLVFAGLILWNPFASTNALWIFIGITLVVESLLDLCSVVFSKAKEEEKPAPPQIEAAPVLEEVPLLEEK